MTAIAPATAFRWFRPAAAFGLQADIGVAPPLSYRAPDNPGRAAQVLFSLSSALKLCSVRAPTRCL